MPLVSRMRLGTCLAESAMRIASLILFTSSWLNTWFEAIFRKRITLSSPSLLYWGMQRLSETSSKASTAKDRKTSLYHMPVFSTGSIFRFALKDLYRGNKQQVDIHWDSQQTAREQASDCHWLPVGSAHLTSVSSSGNPSCSLLLGGKPWFKDPINTNLAQAKVRIEFGSIIFMFNLSHILAAFLPEAVLCLLFV